MKRVTQLALLVGIAFLGIASARATNISGTISSTLTITTDSKLTGDVTCTVASAPCIQFGASGIQLQLNGHTMTGRGSLTACTDTFGEDGIHTNGKDAVSIQGPGIVRRFQFRGIEVTGNDSIVADVTVLNSCQEGILVAGFHNRVEENSVVRSNLNGTFFDTGIWVQGTGGHIIRDNEVVGAVGGGHGIFVGFDPAGDGPSKNNLIEGNSTSANPGGAGIWLTFGSTGNQVVRNQSFGNLTLGDIFDQNTVVGANDYDDNLCELSNVGPTAKNVCEIPDLSGHANPDNGGEN
jgi:hypothetical protein